ncbi:MAG: SIS domain-containing protein, partial [Erysipelotrichaceae bacterium]|nr:SIS domain-containing protein [Erysipelotrichaceae bacterium]
MNTDIIKNDYQLMTDAYVTTDPKMLESYQEAARVTEEAIAAGNKLLLCGNGGSASTASHITNDFISHMINWEREGYPAVALT